MHSVHCTLRARRMSSEEPHMHVNTKLIFKSFARLASAGERLKVDRLPKTSPTIIIFVLTELQVVQVATGHRR